MKSKKEKLKEVFKILFKIKIEEILSRKIKSFGSKAQISLPLRYKGKNTKILIYD